MTRIELKQMRNRFKGTMIEVVRMKMGTKMCKWPTMKADKSDKVINRYREFGIKIDDNYIVSDKKFLERDREKISMKNKNL